MHRKGEGMAPNPARAFMWFSLAAKRGDAKAKAGLREVSKTMPPAEMSQAEATGAGLRGLELSSGAY
ncbi:SEL1-like repeat protein [Bradyrhizobium paxllaeri]|uniref:SEL1-like repeat protein n=1 Tax=Bradyrhizobium paxllaeri TaxID=190148 RepID=UPI000810D16C|nr:SEL1-like repeat protein [Bradyrhizobium paxllaeri]